MNRFKFINFFLSNRKIVYLIGFFFVFIFFLSVRFKVEAVCGCPGFQQCECGLTNDSPPALVCSCVSVAGDWTPPSCPAGTNLSYGSSTEAGNNDKPAGQSGESPAGKSYFCTTYKVCGDSYFPSYWGDNNLYCTGSYGATTCHKNAMCCATGTSRSCTLGSIYTYTQLQPYSPDIPHYADLPACSDATTANSTPKVKGSRDDTFISRTQIGDLNCRNNQATCTYTTKCQQKTCNCVAPPTPTRTPTPTPIPPTSTPIPVPPTATPIPISLTGPNATCGAYDSGTDTFTVLWSWTAKQSLTTTFRLYMYASPPSTWTFDQNVGNELSYSTTSVPANNIISAWFQTLPALTWSTMGTGYCPRPTPTPTRTPTPSPTPTPTPVPVPWIKLKDTSLITGNSLNNPIPPAPILFDATGDDDGSANLIVGTAGLVAAPAINIASLNPSAKTGVPEYKTTTSSVSYPMTPALFLSYVKARKEYTSLTVRNNPDLSQISGSGIYFYNGALTLDNTSITSSKVVLIVAGDVTINEVKFNSSDCITASNSISIISVNGKISFSGTTQCAAGIFIADDIDTGINGALGLKIIGNLIAQNSFTNQRRWASLSQPAVFIKFDPTQYIDLLPYLSMANYDWSQTQ